jgi:hypothetical protein
MLGINYWAVAVAAMAAFVVSSVWYIAFGRQLVKLGSAAGDMNSPAWKKVFVLGEHLVIAFVLALLLAHLDVVDWTHALLLGAGLWIAFPALVVASSIVWENVPRRLGAIHAGDWLAKILVMALILGVWR